jgi:hypothetical protein
MCRNVRPIKWHQKTYHKISWDYPFKGLPNSQAALAPGNAFGPAKMFKTSKFLLTLNVFFFSIHLKMEKNKSDWKIYRSIEHQVGQSRIALQHSGPTKLMRLRGVETLLSNIIKNLHVIHSKLKFILSQMFIHCSWIWVVTSQISRCTIVPGNNSGN